MATKIGNIDSIAGNKVNITATNLDTVELKSLANIAPTYIIPNSIIISAYQNINGEDTGDYSLLVSDSNGNLADLTYINTSGKAINVTENANNKKVIDVLYDNSTIKLNTDNKLFVNIDNNTLEQDKDTENSAEYIHVNTQNLDKATGTQVGVVSVDDITIKSDNGNIAVDTQNLEKASVEKLGVVSVDDSTIVSNDGKISVVTKNLDIASSLLPGVIQYDDKTIRKNTSNQLLVNTPELDKAGTTNYGVVKFDDNTIKLNESNQLNVETKNLSIATDTNPGIVKVAKWKQGLNTDNTKELYSSTVSNIELTGDITLSSTIDGTTYKYTSGVDNRLILNIGPGTAYSYIINSYNNLLSSHKEILDNYTLLNNTVNTLMQNSVLVDNIEYYADLKCNSTVDYTSQIEDNSISSNLNVSYNYYITNDKIIKDIDKLYNSESIIISNTINLSYKDTSTYSIFNSTDDTFTYTASYYENSAKIKLFGLINKIENSDDVLYENVDYTTLKAVKEYKNTTLALKSDINKDINRLTYINEQNTYAFTTYLVKSAILDFYKTSYELGDDLNYDNDILITNKFNFLQYAEIVKAICRNYSNITDDKYRAIISSKILPVKNDTNYEYKLNIYTNPIAKYTNASSNLNNIYYLDASVVNEEDSYLKTSTILLKSKPIITGTSMPSPAEDYTMMRNKLLKDNSNSINEFINIINKFALTYKITYLYENYIIFAKNFEDLVNTILLFSTKLNYTGKANKIHIGNNKLCSSVDNQLIIRNNDTYTSNTTVLLPFGTPFTYKTNDPLYLLKITNFNKLYINKPNNSNAISLFNVLSKVSNTATQTYDVNNLRKNIVGLTDAYANKYIMQKILSGKYAIRDYTIINYIDFKNIHKGFINSKLSVIEEFNNLYKVVDNINYILNKVINSTDINISKLNNESCLFGMDIPLNDIIDSNNEWVNTDIIISSSTMLSNTNAEIVSGKTPVAADADALPSQNTGTNTDTEKNYSAITAIY